jgi:AcrR family transcriptional regulator
MSDATLSRPIDRRRAQTRREILDAAWALCREQGLANLSLRELAGRVGLRAPSLYSYFGSKHDIYDAMFAEGQVQLAERLAAVTGTAPSRESFRAGNRAFFEFCTEDPVRYQLLFQRTLGGFEPSEESYALAVANFDLLADHLRAMGVTDPRQADLWTAMASGLISQQLANDPGGDRWGRLLDEAVDVFCDHVGIPATRTTRRTTRRTR